MDDLWIDPIECDTAAAQAIVGSRRPQWHAVPVEQHETGHDGRIRHIGGQWQRDPDADDGTGHHASRRTGGGRAYEHAAQTSPARRHDCTSPNGRLDRRLPTWQGRRVRAFIAAPASL
jgi:hypothetical protein